MFIPRLRKINQVVYEIKEQDPNSAMTSNLLRTMVIKNMLSKIKYSNAWLINLDELYGFFVKKNKKLSNVLYSNNSDNTSFLPKKKMNTGEIYRTFLEQDKNTIVRKTNMRSFSKNANIKHTICQKKWLIDFEDFVGKVNLKELCEYKTLPRLRTKISAQNEWNAHHRTKIKHHIIDKICDAKKVFVYKHGKTNIINYDELEKELKKILKNKKIY